MENKPGRILIVDDDPDIVEVVGFHLKSWGYEIDSAPSAQDAFNKAKDFKPAIVLSDVVMQNKTGLDLQQQFKKVYPNSAFIFMTASSKIDWAVEAMRQGAMDYIVKPIDFQRLKKVIEKGMEYYRALDEMEVLQEELTKKGRFGHLVGAAAPMRELYKMIKSVAVTCAPTLITGESGTGKELVARTIHELGPRHKEPFIAINCGAIVETLIESEIFGHEKGAFTDAKERQLGCFEMANGGTLFLDEIGEMPMPLQPKLLRVLEDRRVRRLGGRQEIEVDVHVLAATNRDPETSIREGKLRNDLYYRLNVFSIKTPALREHKQDLPMLIMHFLNEMNKKYNLEIKGLTPKVKDQFMQYDWPGNVRELRNVMERAAILCRKGFIGLKHLPIHLRNTESIMNMAISIPLGISLEKVEEYVVKKTLEITGNNKSEAARLLHVDKKTIYNMLNRFGINDEAEPSTPIRARHHVGGLDNR